jgi:hypothetical protein
MGSVPYIWNFVSCVSSDFLLAIFSCFNSDECSAMQDEDIIDKFGEYGTVKAGNLSMMPRCLLATILTFFVLQ